MFKNSKFSLTKTSSTGTRRSMNKMYGQCGEKNSVTDIINSISIKRKLDIKKITTYHWTIELKGIHFI